MKPHKHAFVGSDQDGHACIYVMEIDKDGTTGDYFGPDLMQRIADRINKMRLRLTRVLPLLLVCSSGWHILREQAHITLGGPKAFIEMPQSHSDVCAGRDNCFQISHFAVILDGGMAFINLNTDQASWEAVTCKESQ